MQSGPIDISSDEEAAHNTDVEDDSVDWLSNLIDCAEKGSAGGDDDDDDLVVIGEVNSGGMMKSTKPTVKVVDDDDDCVVLDGDPDKAVSVVDESAESDELTVVGEKGQIACRDYPHSRHLCAKFPFSSTPHERHCELCHCYVCDSLAPCVHWGIGGSQIGHCHATEKEEMWKIMRRNFKMGRSASMPAIKVSLALPQLSQAPPLDIIRLAPNSIPQTQVTGPTLTRTYSSVNHTMPGPTSVSLNQVPRSTLVRAVSSANLTHASVRNPGRSHQSVPLFNNGIQPSSVQLLPASQQFPSHQSPVRNVVRSSRAQNIGNAGLRCTSSPTVFKRVGPVRGPFPKNQTGYGRPYNSSCVNPYQYGLINNSGSANSSQYGRYPTPMAPLNDGIPYSWQDIHSSLNQIPPQPVGSTIVGSALPSQAPTYNQPITQLAHSQNVYQQGNQSQNDGPNFCQYGIQSQCASPDVSLHGVGASAVDLGFADCSHGWMNNSSQTIQQPPIENSQVQSTDSLNGPPLVKEPDFQSNGYPNLKGLESEFDNWLLDNQPVLPAPNDSMAAQLDLLSPGPLQADAGMLLFDFETSFNSLTQV